DVVAVRPRCAARGDCGGCAEVRAGCGAPGGRRTRCVGCQGGTKVLQSLLRGGRLSSPRAKPRSETAPLWHSCARGWLAATLAFGFGPPIHASVPSNPFHKRCPMDHDSLREEGPVTGELLRQAQEHRRLCAQGQDPGQELTKAWDQFYAACHRILLQRVQRSP